MNTFAIILIIIVSFITVIYAITKFAPPTPIPTLPISVLPDDGNDNIPTNPGDSGNSGHSGHSGHSGVPKLPTNAPNTSAITPSGQITQPTPTQVPNAFIANFIGSIDMTKLPSTPKNIFPLISLNPISITSNTLGVKINNDYSLNLSNLSLTAKYNVNINTEIYTKERDNPSTYPSTTEIQLNAGISYTNPLTKDANELFNTTKGNSVISINWGYNDMQFKGNDLYYYLYYSNSKNFDLTNTDAFIKINVSIYKVVN